MTDTVSELIELINETDDIDIIIDSMYQIVIDGKKKLSDSQIVFVCDVLFNKNNSGFNLALSNILFVELHKANERIIEVGEETLGLGYHV